MDNKWRIFFINHDYQKLISGLLIINISKAIEIAQKYNLISRNELTNKQQGLKIRIGQDISDASEVMRLKVNLIDPDRYNNYEANFVIAPINKNSSEFICIYKFKEYILYRSRMDHFEESVRLNRKRIVYGTNINKCIELSKKYNEKYYKWHNPKFF